MPSTNQMILDLMANGFKLPEGLEWIDLPKPHSEHYKPYWSHNRHGDIVDQQAHDLCAMRWARDRRAWPQLDYDAYHDAMIRGDSAAAIKALWEACGGRNEQQGRAAQADGTMGEAGRRGAGRERERDPYAADPA